MQLYVRVFSNAFLTYLWIWQDGSTLKMDLMLQRTYQTMA